MARHQLSLAFLAFTILGYIRPILASMPTFFSADEARFDRYAACLAATEQLRRDRGSDGNTDEYIKDASRILSGLGSSLEEYNEIGREVLENSDLKQRVMSQAFLYRVESSITTDKMPMEAMNEAVVKDVKGDKLQRFCKSMFEIERLRRMQLGQLNALSGLASVVPEGSLTAVAPLLQPEARGLVEEFPKQAAAIASQYGLSAKEFNTMLHATRKSTAFRKRVQAAFVG